MPVVVDAVYVDTAIIFVRQSFLHPAHKITYRAKPKFYSTPSIVSVTGVVDVGASRPRSTSSLSKPLLRFRRRYKVTSTAMYFLTCA